VSAHPKVDKKKEELITFGYDLFGENGSNLKYSLFNKDNEMTNYMDIPIRGPVMIHDMAITGEHVIFNDLPLQFKPLNVNIGKQVFEFNKNMSARYGVMKRNETDKKNIKWFDLPNHYVYHFVNAWDSTNEEGDEIVTMFGCALSKVNLEFKH
jgi:carotenoid 9,10(9',10')-cleavage dioxygenase 1